MVAYPFRLDLLSGGRFIAPIENDNQFSYFWSDDYDAFEYLSAAHAGCIAVTFENSLIYELQESYGVLDWGNLHISKRQAKDYGNLDRKHFSLRLTKSYDAVYSGLSVREDNWMNKAYVSLLFSIDQVDFKPIAVELYYGNKLIAGEIGYETGGIYTSLSGFFDRDSQVPLRQPGFLQLQSLALYLERRGLAFWNLGHPHMSYKHELGSVTVPRLEFLNRFVGERRQESYIQYETVSLGDEAFNRLFC